ncbi:hypothetical protein HA402_000642 [Bradysia odoriphaga]|nr:hypothetical protein HA402_000642 [Bradysia odoriphaga]
MYSKLFDRVKGCATKESNIEGAGGTEHDSDVDVEVVSSEEDNVVRSDKRSGRKSRSKPSILTVSVVGVRQQSSALDRGPRRSTAFVGDRQQSSSLDSSRRRSTAVVVARQQSSALDSSRRRSTAVVGARQQSSAIDSSRPRNTTQDGLENFFGCVKSCNQSNTTTASQYRTGYATMLINNITGTNSLRANCQPDNSTSMLTNIHEFISACQQQNRDNALYPEAELISRGCDNLSLLVEKEECDSMIVFDPETDDDDSNLVFHTSDESDDGIATNRIANVNLSQTEIISNDANWVFQKLFKTSHCNDCTENFNLMDPKAALMSIEKLLGSINKTLAEVCSENSVKQKILLSVESANINVIGCADHIDVIERKVKNLAVDRTILSFCTNINQFLSGKITSLPENPSIIQKLAFEHRNKKKGIGKYAKKKFIEK